MRTCVPVGHSTDYHKSTLISSRMFSDSEEADRITPSAPGGYGDTQADVCLSTGTAV